MAGRRAAVSRCLGVLAGPRSIELVEALGPEQLLKSQAQVLGPLLAILVGAWPGAILIRGHRTEGFRAESAGLRLAGLLSRSGSGYSVPIGYRRRP